MDSLPSRSRQYSIRSAAARCRKCTTIQGTARVGGARSKEGSLLVDGFYNLDETFAMPKTRHSQDSIQEFQVVTFGGAAEYGRALGGVINAITKSGGNEFRGSGYGFFRSEQLNEQDFGEKALDRPKSEFRRQQWGGSFGGPLKQNKSFFFGAYERTSEDTPFDNGITPLNGAIIGLPADDVGIVPRFLRLNFAMGKWNHNLRDTQRLKSAYVRNADRSHGVAARAVHCAGGVEPPVYVDHAAFVK